MDLVLLIMNERGVNHLLQDKVALGGEASVAAGPVGRDTRAMTDAQLKSEILSYSRSQGLFAGIALTGATLRQDLDDNANIYGRKITNREVINMKRRMPPAAQRLIELLNKYSAREEQRSSAQ